MDPFVTRVYQGRPVTGCDRNVVRFRCCGPFTNTIVERSCWSPARWDGDSCFRLAPWCMTKMSESAGGRVPVLCDLNEPFRAFTPAAAEAALRHRHFWSSRGRSPTVLVDLLAKPQGSPTASRDRENSNTQQSHKVLEHHLGLSEMPTSHGS
jgi:hypothetical protein